MSETALEAVLRRDRAIVIAALAALTALAWADLVWLAQDMKMDGMDMTGFRSIPAGRGLMMPADAPWQPIEFGYVFAMWAVMMIGMMTPSVAPARGSPPAICCRGPPFRWRQLRHNGRLSARRFSRR